MTQFHRGGGLPLRQALVRLSCFSLASILLASGTAAADESSGGPQSTAATYQLDGIVVTAPQTVAPLTVVTDPKAPQQPMPPADGAGYLKNIPGMSVVRKGGSGGDPLLRGLGGSRLNVVLDGTELLGGCGGRMDPPTAYVFPESYDRISVIKGPQTVVHGPGNVAGTVLFERETPRFTEPGYRGTISALGGSFGRNDQLVDVAAGAKPGYVRAIGTRSHSDDYEDGGGDKVRSFYNRSSFTGIVGWTPDADTLLEGTFDWSKARAAYADRTMDGPVFDRQGAKLMFSKTNLSPLFARVKATGYYNYIDHVMDNYSLRPVGAMPMASNPDRATWGGNALADLAIAPDLTLTVGADYKHDKHTLRSQNAAEYRAGISYKDKPRIPDMSFDQLGVFGELKYDLSKDKRVISGLRADFVRVENEAPGRRADDENQLVSGFARYEQDFTLGIPVTGYVGLGHVQRTADWWERSRVFALKPEKSTQIDIGLTHSGDRVSGGVALFAANIDDFIQITTAAPGARNIDARTMGFEVDGGYKVTSAWTVNGSIAYVYGENRTTGRALSQIPPLEFRTSVQYDDGTFLGGAVMRAVTSQNRVDPGNGTIIGTDIGPSGGFTVFSAYVGWRARENVLFTVGVDNLFNREYAEHVSKGQSPSVTALGYPTSLRVEEPGRTVWLKGVVTF